MFCPDSSRLVARLGLLASLVLGSVACATLPKAPATPAAPPPARVVQVPKPLTPPATAVQPPLDLGALVSACQSLQARTGLPIACRTSYDGGVLTMSARFESRLQLAGYGDALQAQLGAKFCAAAAHSGQPARVSLELHGRGQLVWDCQRGSWSGWQAAARPTAPVPATICAALDRDPAMPVRCRATASNGTASMTIRFPSEELAKPLMAAMLDDVGTPFCASNLALRRASLVQVRYEASKRGRSFNCETRSWGAPYSLETGRAPTGPAAAPTPATPAAPARVLGGDVI